VSSAGSPDGSDVWTHFLNTMLTNKADYTLPRWNQYLTSESNFYVLLLFSLMIFQGN
jgi:hypothetical protein